MDVALDFRNMTVWLLVLALILATSRLIPLAGVRRVAAVALRCLGVVLLGLAHSGLARPTAREQPRHVIYAIDRSKSLDPAQRDWVIRRVASLEAQRPPQVRRAVVVFGRDAKTAIPFGTDPFTEPDAVHRALDSTPVDPTQTNLEAALLASISLSPPGKPSRVILVTDGNETEGQALGAAAHLSTLGLEIYPIAVVPPHPVELVWEELASPPVVQRGSPIPIRAVLHNGTSQTQRVRLAVELAGMTIHKTTQTIPPGWHVVSMAVPSIQRGTMALDVVMSGLQGEQAERRRLYVEVEGPPHVLVVTEHTAALPMFASALKRREFDISLVRPSDLASDAGPLLAYDAVAVFQVPKSVFTEPQVRALRIYLEQYGGGLIHVGLGGILHDELSHPAPLDGLLPVVFEPKGLHEAERRVCIVLLIDRSASMFGPRLSATKHAAVELVKQLAPEDLLGIFAFDEQPYVVAEVQPASQVRAEIIEKLIRLKSSGGTNLYPALMIARDRLALTGSTIKHVILLSDGKTPFSAPQYRALMEELRRDRVSLSTIGIGAGGINVGLLEWLAESTGGTFYQLRDLGELPQLIARDTQNALGRLPFSEGLFAPERAPGSDWFAEIDEFPPLRGYLTATAKPGSTVDLIIPKPSFGGSGEPQGPDPLLARWSVGLGRVAVLTSDADIRWSPDWVRWRNFEGWWASVVRWAMRPRLSEELSVAVDERGPIPQLVVEGVLHNPTAELLDVEGLSPAPLSLVQRGPWRWQASLEPFDSGWYQLVIRSGLPAAPIHADEPHAAQAGLPAPSRLDLTLARQAGPSPVASASEAPPAVFASRWIRIGSRSALGELVGQGPNDRLLRQLAELSHGTLDAPDQAFLPPTESVPYHQPLASWLLPLVILAVLADVALRGRTML